MSRRLDRALNADLTYDAEHVGASLGVMPPGYRQLREVGHLGVDCFERAFDGLFHWDMHRGAGLKVLESAPVAAEGVVVVTGLGIGPLRAWAPCRVVRVIDEPNRKGFAYGTLPGHPVTGEEGFVVVRGEDDDVHLEVTAFSRPATLAARLGGPVSPLLQRLVCRRYIAALRP